MALAALSEADRRLLEQIRADLPGWPPAATDSWLFEVAKGKGWPPDGGWRYVLMRRTLENWKLVTWHEEAIEVDAVALSPMAQYTVVGMIRAYSGEHNEFSNIHDTRERIESLAGFIAENGTWPIPPILYRTDGGFDIVDGNHRVVSLMLVRHWHATGQLPDRYRRPDERHQALMVRTPENW